MSNRLDVDFEIADNDASSAAFGWDFQENAGIFLFLNFIKRADSIIIESKYEDIEISLTESGNIYAQAKALQDESTTGTENLKLRKAILSLAKLNVTDNDMLIYISNLRAPIDGDKYRFANDIVSFNQCAPDQKDFIKKQTEVIINDLQRKIDSGKLSSTKQLKYLELQKRLKEFKYDKFYVASIYPFIEGIDRYKVLRDRTIQTLSNDMAIESDKVLTIVDKVLAHWQKVLKFNSTIADKGNDRKYINKSDFVWTVIALYGDSIPFNMIQESLSGSFDTALEADGDRYLNDEKNLYHERFEFMVKVIRAYEEFKKTARGIKADEAFICSDEWKKFSYEFEDISDTLLREYITKCYIYRIIRRNRDFANIKKGVNL